VDGHPQSAVKPYRHSERVIVTLREHWRSFLQTCDLPTTLVLLVVLSPYRLAHLNAFFEPWDEVKNTDVQLAQALIACDHVSND
jgi:cell division protein FtsW (lipid II flippase)